MVREWNPLPLAKMGRESERERHIERERERERERGGCGAVRQSLFWLGKNAAAAQRASDFERGGVICSSQCSRKLDTETLPRVELQNSAATGHLYVKATDSKVQNRSKCD